MGNSVSKDGAVTKVCESIPVVGSVTALFHLAAGNKDHAVRAAAVSTGSLIKAAGAVGGFCVGGPLGAVAGGAAAASLGIGAEYGISKAIDDPAIKGDVGEVTLKRIAIETVIGGGTAVFGGGGAAAAKEAGTQIVRTTAGQITKGLLKEALEEGGKELLRQGTKVTLTQLGTKTAAQVGVAAVKQIGNIQMSGKLEPKQGDPEPDDDDDDRKKKKKMRMIVTFAQAHAAEGLRTVIDDVILQLQNCANPAIFTQRGANVAVTVPIMTETFAIGPDGQEIRVQENDEAITAILLTLKTAVDLIRRTHDVKMEFNLANTVYRGGSQLANFALDQKWAKLLQFQWMGNHGAEIHLWQVQLNRVNAANNAVQAEMSTGGEPDEI